ncbi:MAG TPA: ABC transporter permease [Coriobacteriia bacterium]
MSESHEATVTESRWMSVLRTIGVPILSVLLAVGIGSLILLAGGYDPLKAYAALFQGAFGGPMRKPLDAIGDTLVRSTPLMFTGLAVGFGFRANLFNIGAEGQFILGSLGAAWFGLLFAGLPTIASIPLILIGAALFGAAWAFIPALLKARTGAHEVITTMMFSWIALYLTSWIISGPLAESATNNFQTPMLSSAVWLPTLDKIIPGLPALKYAHAGLLVAIAAAIVVALLLRRTTLGYEVRAVGFNPTAAQNGGISIPLTTIWALCISGALAGMAGASEVLGVTHRMYDQVSAGAGYGFTGIAVALLGRKNPAGIIVAALLFGALSAGSGTMQLFASVPDKIVMIIQALIIFFVGAETIVSWYVKRRQRLALERRGAGHAAE